MPVLVALAGCASAPQPGAGRLPGVAQTGSVPAPSKRVMQLEVHILAGEMALQRGKSKRAAQEYVAALAYSNDAKLAARATRIALVAGDPGQAYRAADAWAKADPKAMDAQKVAARLALRAGAADALRRHALAVVNLNPDGPGEGLHSLADVLTGDPDQAALALATMNHLAATHPKSPDACYAKALLALRYNAYGQAESAIARALQLRPHWPDAALLRASLLVREGKLDAAQQWVAGLGGSKSVRAAHQIAYARLLLGANANGAAADAFERALALKPDDADARYGLGVLALSLKQWDRARQAFSTLYRSGHRRGDAAYYLGVLAEQSKNYAGARRWYRRVNGGGHVIDAKLRAAIMRDKLGDTAGARAEFRQLRQANPDLGARLYLAEGQMLYDSKRYNTALAMYNRALRDDPANSDLLYGRSLIYERLGAIDKAEIDLRKILDTKPNDPRALNALGYMLSNHSSRYQQALDYIRRALKAEPDDPAVLDSMGWVQYRLGNLAKARGFLQRAFAQFPDPEIAAHLGEVLWKSGDQADAREIWRQGKNGDPDNKVLQETVNRLAH